MTETTSLIVKDARFSLNDPEKNIGEWVEKPIELPKYFATITNEGTRNAVIRVYNHMIKNIDKKAHDFTNGGRRGAYLSYNWQNVCRDEQISKMATTGLMERYNWIIISSSFIEPSSSLSYMFQGGHFTYHCPYLLIWFEPSDPEKTYKTEYRRIRAEGKI